MKIGIGLILSVLTYFATNKYVALCQLILIKNKVDQSIPFEDQFWVHASIFTFTILVILIVLATTSTNWKASFLISSLNILVGFALNILFINYLNQYSISPKISNEFKLSYHALFLVPTLSIVPILLVNLIQHLKNEKLIEKAQFLKGFNADFRIKRFLGNIADIVICLIINFLLVQLSVFDEYLFSFIITYFLYKYILEASTKTTVGKNLFNLIIKSSAEKKLKSWHFLLRNICRIVPFYALPVLLNKPAIHDLISGTRVIEQKSI